MGLNPTDKIPYGIEKKEGYIAVRDYYQSNKDNFTDERSRTLINSLPKPDDITDLEIRAIMIEVACGYLENGYHKDDGKYKMGAYAKAILEEMGGINELTQEEKEKIKNSPIGCFLSR